MNVQDFRIVEGIAYLGIYMFANDWKERMYM